MQYFFLDAVFNAGVFNVEALSDMCMQFHKWCFQVHPEMFWTLAGVLFL